MCMGFPGGSTVKTPPAMQEAQETWVRSLGWEDPGNGNPLLYSCPENPMDRGAWRATVHGIVELNTTEHACITYVISFPLTETM